MELGELSEPPPLHRESTDSLIIDTIGNQLLFLIARCPASGILPVGVVLHNQAVEHNVAAFSECCFAVCLQGKLNRG